MRAIILIIFAILCAGTCKAQILDLTPVNGKMRLLIDFNTRNISVSNPEVKSFSLQWPDGSEMSIDLLRQNKFKFNKLIKKLTQHPYTHLHVGRGFYNDAKNKDTKLYKYVTN